MRRLLNLNQPILVFVEVIGIFMVLIPAVLYGVMLLWNETGSARTLVLSIIKISFLLGAFLLIVFLALILAEQVQDHYYDVKYQEQRSQKVLLSNGYYECQYCGNQRVKENDKTCDVCGKEFGLVKIK
jgi:uncharacterized paraquat-inducible protein A